MAKESKKQKEAREKKEKSEAKKLKQLHADEGKKRKDARDKAEHSHNNKIHHKKPHKGLKMVKVKGLCNMHCADGYSLEVGKVCEITENEAKRLSEDSRQIKFFEKT